MSKGDDEAMEPTTPTTKHGRGLMESWVAGDMHPDDAADLQRDIRAIEKEAAQQERERLRPTAAALRDLMVTQYRYVNQTGGQPTTDDDMDRAVMAAVEVLRQYGDDDPSGTPSGIEEAMGWTDWQWRWYLLWLALWFPDAKVVQVNRRQAQDFYDRCREALG